MFVLRGTFTPAHNLKHKRAQILYIDVDQGDLSENEEDDAPATDVTIEDQDHKVPTISVHALNGSPTYNCMRIMGQYGKRKLHPLIDPGSTHNFVDLQMAKVLGCNLKAIKPMTVLAASGDLITNYKCSDFTWKTQGYKFQIRTLAVAISSSVFNGSPH